MAKRIITTEITEEDKKIETGLRPKTLDEYIGQAKAREILNVSMRAAKIRNEVYWFDT